MVLSDAKKVKGFMITAKKLATEKIRALVAFTRTSVLGSLALAVFPCVSLQRGN